MALKYPIIIVDLYTSPCSFIISYIVDFEALCFFFLIA